MLFGIALQRAIEHTTDRLNPTLAASIAMESAVAMSKATLPTALSDLFQSPSPAPDIEVTSKPTAPDIAVTSKPTASDIAVTSKPAATALPLPQVRAPRKKRTPGVDAKTLEAGFLSTRMRSAKVLATVMSLAIVAVTSAAWKNERRADTPAIAHAATGLRAPAIARAATALKAAAFRPATANPFAAPSDFEDPAQFEQPVQQAPTDSDAPPTQETPPERETLQPPQSDEDLPTAVPDQGEGIITEDWQQSA